MYQIIQENICKGQKKVIFVEVNPENKINFNKNYVI